jgi:tetratricopeptide (TPR) repeat protein
MAEQQTTPADPQPFSLVFKVAKGALLREEVERFVKLWPRARAHKAFAQILEPVLTLTALVDDYDCAVAYEHVAAAFGRKASVSLRDVVNEALHNETKFEVASELIDSTARALVSLYAYQEDVFAWEIARYYLERWVPHFQLAVEEAVELAPSHYLLTMRHLNPSYFASATHTSAEAVQRAAESPKCDLVDVVMPMLNVRRPIRGPLLVYERELSLELDLSALSTSILKQVMDLSHVSVWMPANDGTRLYSRYYTLLQRAFLGEDLSRAFVAIGGHWFHNPLHHLSRPLMEYTRRLVTTRAAPAHGDLHPGNVLAVGSVPVLIDYGLSDVRLPVGVDAARLFGCLVRDVFSTLSLDELSAVLRAVVMHDADALQDSSVAATRAAAILDQIQSASLGVMGDGASELWPLHLYGFAFIALKWDAEMPGAHVACGLLAAVALTRLLGSPSPDDLLAVQITVPDHQSSDVAPEQPAEILVVVAKFYGSAEYDPTARVFHALEDNLRAVIPEIARVEYIDYVVLSRKDAVALAARYQASMVVWGTYDNLGIRPRYDVTRDSLAARLSMIQLDEATRHSLREKFNVYITEDLGAEISFLSLKAVGDMCMLNLNFTAALRVYEKCLSLVSDIERQRAMGAAEIHLNIASILFSLRKYEEALAANARASELVPGDLLTRIQALPLRAAVQKRSLPDMLEELRSILRERLSANPEPDQREGLVAALAQLEKINSPNDLKEFAEEASRVSKAQDFGSNAQFTKDVAVHLSAGHDAVDRGDFRTALREFKLALRLNPNCARAFAGRAKVLAITDKVSAALEDLSRAERLDRREHLIYKYRAFIYMEAEQYEASLENVEKVRDLGFGRRSVLLPWGFSLLALDRGEEMMATIKSEQMDPHDEHIFILRAAYFRTALQYDVALREIDDALVIAPTSAYVAHERVRIYVAQKNSNAAITEARRMESLAKPGTFTRRKAKELVSDIEELFGASFEGDGLPKEEAQSSQA